MSQKLYVGNLSFDATEDSLRELLSQFGEVHSVSIITDRATGQSRGFGFVEMDAQSAQQAISNLDGKEFQGRNLTVNEARERQPRGGDRRGSRGGW